MDTPSWSHECILLSDILCLGNDFCYLNMQGELSVQFDDLFMKAWEDNIVPEYEGDGMYDLHFDILFMDASVFEVMIS